MPSSFLICYPDVPPNALVVTEGQAFDEDFCFKLENAFYGERHNYAQTMATHFSYSVTFDLGTGNSRTLDHFILGGTKILVQQGVVGAYVAGSNNGSTWTNQLGCTINFNTRNFNGPDRADLIFTATYNDLIAGVLAAYRYFRVTINAGFAIRFPLSKMYFGTSFDMGKEPDFYNLEVLTERDSDTWRYTRGHVLMTRAFFPLHKVTVEWDGVSDAQATAFMTSVLNNPYRDYVYLYTATALDPLYDNRLMYCKVLDDECEVIKVKQNYNNIKAVFLESL
jgi:hypothetical protein